MMPRTRLTAVTTDAAAVTISSHDAATSAASDASTAPGTSTRLAGVPDRSWLKAEQLGLLPPSLSHDLGVCEVLDELGPPFGEAPQRPLGFEHLLRLLSKALRLLGGNLHG